MNSLRTFGRSLGIVLLGALATACISLFPKENPAQLYRFGPQASAPPTAPAPGNQRFSVINPIIAFDRAAASARILTVTNDQAAYIKGSRWVAPASTLFESALENAFYADPGPARLMAAGEVGHGDYALRLDVREFDVRYDHGAGAAPDVVVDLHATLTRLDGRAFAGERTFQARVPAQEDRVGAIAPAFDQAVGKVLGELVAWVDAKGSSA
jgi:cholesterol transport system auxiliary component